MPKAPTKAKKTVKKTTEKGEKAPVSRSFGGMTRSQIKTLQALKSGKSLTRSDLAEATGIAKGWSKILGNKAGTHEDALETKKYVKTTIPPEGERGLRYTITARGKQALEKALKEMAKAGKEL